MYSIFFLFLLIILSIPPSSSSIDTCGSTCGGLPVQYPLGTGLGCGSPRFHPCVTCSHDTNPDGELLLTTHTGTYPITAISYASSTVTISPVSMSTCSSIHNSTTTDHLGLDSSGPFQLGPSLFILLNCPSSTSSLTYKGSSSSPICDTTRSYLCSLVHTCPTIVTIGLPLFASTSSCCVYSPAELGPGDVLDLKGMHCSAYMSVVSFGDATMNPMLWEYGVVLRYEEEGGFEEYGGSVEVRKACEQSGGVCGYQPPENYFTCLCGNGVNTSRDCVGQEKLPEGYWSSTGSGEPSAVRFCSASSSVIVISVWIFFLYILF